jgi:hypothetical protein
LELRRRPALEPSRNHIAASEAKLCKLLRNTLRASTAVLIKKQHLGALVDALERLNLQRSNLRGTPASLRIKMLRRQVCSFEHSIERRRCTEEHAKPSHASKQRAHTCASTPSTLRSWPRRRRSISAISSSKNRPRAEEGTSGTPVADFSLSGRMSMMATFESLATRSTARAGVISPVGAQ